MIQKKFYFGMLGLCLFIFPATYSNNEVKSKKNRRLISFNFDNEDLTTVISEIAAAKNINVIFPQPPHAITGKITLVNQKKLTVDQAFEKLSTILEMAGYTMALHGNTYIISKSSAGTLRETFPIYIGIDPNTLPDTDEYIRYLYYFDNIKIPPGATGQAQEIKAILEDMLQEPNKPGAAQIIFNSGTNCVIITAKSYSIKIAMRIIAELDKTGFREVLEIIQLANVSADFVAKFLNEQLLTAAPGTPAALTPPEFDTHYFTKATKIIADPRANTLIILGKTQTVDRLKNFIYKYIDLPLESGESVIHVYELQYLDAQKFAEDLRNIIKTPEPTGQARGISLEGRSFQGVIIEAERVGEVNKLQTQIGDVGTAVQGGNRLIIAAKKNDWGALKQLIDSLDKPQPQVALEVLVVDVSLGDEKKFGDQVRNRIGALPKDVNAQFAGLDAPVLNSPPTTLATDLLLQKVVDGELQNVASTATPGSFILSFNDPNNNGIWWVLEMLKRFSSTKILSHPHLITLNQVQAKVSVDEKRRVDGPVKQNPDSSLVRLKVDISAGIQVEILPRINLSNSINLQIAVKVNNFIEGSDAKNTRTVVTNATVGNGEVLVLGGLVKTSSIDNNFEVPALGKIPIIGPLFFKARARTVTKDNLMIFISPTVIKPKIGGGMSEVSEGKFGIAKNMVDKSELFEQIKDPITRWFFNAPKDSTKGLMNAYKDRDFFSKTSLKGGEPETVLKEQRQQRIDQAKGRNRQEAREARERKSKGALTAPVEQHSATQLKALVAHEKNPLLANN